MLRRTPLKRSGFKPRSVPLAAKWPRKVPGKVGRSPRAVLIERLTKACHAYVRARDWGRPCISCGEILIADYDAGHCRSVGSAAHLRFDAERNIHGQCRICNQTLMGNREGYLRFLPVRIGIEAFEALMTDQADRKFSAAVLGEMIVFFEMKLRELQCR